MSSTRKGANVRSASLGQPGVTRVSLIAGKMRRGRSRPWWSVAVATWLLSVSPGLAYGWPWSTDMDKQPSIRPQEGPRLPPPNSVPRQGKEAPMDRIEAGERLRNPVRPTQTSIENGRRLFQITCALCHGPEAKGGGPVAAKFVPPPDLTLEIFRQRSDGFLYATIRDGGALMPGQGEALSAQERWDVVNYIRDLQKQALRRTQQNPRSGTGPLRDASQKK